jgi:hypothetical protein
VVLAQLIVGVVASEQPVRLTPAAVALETVPSALTGALSTKVVVLELGIEAIVVVAAMDVPLMLPLKLIPGISPALLVQVTVVVPFTVLAVQFDRTIGAVWLFVPPRSLTFPVFPTVVAVQAFIRSTLPVNPAVVEALPNVSRKGNVVVTAPVLYVSCTCDSVAPDEGCTLAVTATVSVFPGVDGLIDEEEIVGAPRSADAVAKMIATNWQRYFICEGSDRVLRTRSACPGQRRLSC